MAMKRKLMVMGLAVLLGLAGAQTVGIPPTNAQTPTPGTGSISGRVYVDLNANNMFESPDVGFPALLGISPAPSATTQAAEDGTYIFSELPAGTHVVGIIYAIPSCARTAPFRWTGEPVNGGCGFNHYTTLGTTIELAPGEHRTGVDLAQVPETLMTGRVWLDAQPVPPAVPVAFTVGGRSCWNASITSSTTPAGVGYSTYSARLEPLADPQCQLGEIDLSVGGRPANKRLSWESFWRGQVDGGIARFTYFEVEVPGFLGISGQAIEAGTVTPENVARHEGMLLPDPTEVRAFVGATQCAAVGTKALRTAPSEAHPTGEFGGNLFGLIVPPAGVKPGCGTQGATVTFCVGDFKATQPAAGPFSTPGPGTPVTWEASKRADITLEPTTEPCLAVAATLGPAPTEQIPASLPATGGGRAVRSN
jgi:hypothetical protein